MKCKRKILIKLNGNESTSKVDHQQPAKVSSYEKFSEPETTKTIPCILNMMKKKKNSKNFRLLQPNKLWMCMGKR